MGRRRTVNVWRRDIWFSTMPALVLAEESDRDFGKHVHFDFAVCNERIRKQSMRFVRCSICSLSD